MEDILKWSPLVNTAIIILTAILSIAKVNDMLQRFEKTLNRVDEEVQELTIRMAKQETICAERMSFERKRL